MTDVSAEEQLRTQVRAALKASGRKQIWIAEKLGISPKHLSQMLTGRVSLTVDWAQRIAELCDARLLIFVTKPPGSLDRETRIRLDDFTSDQLDGLYDDLDRYAEVVGEMNETAVRQAKEIARLRADIAGCRAQEWPQRLGRAEKLLRRFVDLAAVTHRYGAMGGHDSLGENLGCAGCALRDQARSALDTPEHAP
jgi:transcriptional regulator with XRE-family HTH domain